MKNAASETTEVMKTVYGGLKKESELISEANSQLTRAQTKKNEETRSNRSQDRYSKASLSRVTRPNLPVNDERKSAQSIKQAKSEATPAGDLLSQADRANALGEVLQDNLLEETGKLGMQWVAHDRLGDENV